MNKRLINWLGLTGLLAFISYTAAVIIAPSAFPGYNWMEQAVSDLSAETAPSRMLPLPYKRLTLPAGKPSPLCSRKWTEVILTATTVATKPPSP